MSERRPSFRQRDLERAIKAAEAAGKEVVRVEIEGGKLIIVTSRPGAKPAEEINEWNGAGVCA
jgi:hypothetical protein